MHRESVAAPVAVRRLGPGGDRDAARDGTQPRHCRHLRGSQLILSLLPKCGKAGGCRLVAGDWHLERKSLLKALK